MTTEAVPNTPPTLQHRKEAAMQRAQALSTLLLGEMLDLGPDITVMAVPNGWVFTQRHKAGITSTYVPMPQQPQIEQQKIVLPNL